MNDTTRQWVRNASDEKAATNGCWFDVEVGAFTVFWIERHCCLYEGEWAGEPLILRGCAECEYGLPRIEAWDEAGLAIAFERAERHVECFKSGHRLDWPYEVTMRLFGWRKQSERWLRAVRRFRQASIWVPKKNKKSPTMAAWGLHLLAGDGEQGQKVYFGAKDGAQAREISGKHAIEMVLASDELTAECDINKSLMQVTHVGTRSILKPISSGDSKTQKSKEGINGCVLIDETHVVDRAFMNRISRAGISRSEPLQIEVSTAGNDPESYGKQRYDYGRQVAEGTLDNEQLLWVSYEAPQDLSDEAIAADPVKYGMLANPAWGHTVNEEEFVSDYNQSVLSVGDLADFKMYRLNIWQQSENPWLNISDWQQCERRYDESSLLGRECGGGLDLAKTTDTTALVLVFPEPDGTFRQLAYFWLPEDAATKRAHLVRYKQWARDGWITLTPDATTDFQIVRHGVLDLFRKFNVTKFYFDDTYAAQLVQRIIEEDGMPGNVFEAFKQSMMNFAGPAANYERMIIDSKLHHNGNPVLTWQACNVRSKKDNNENRRPVKQKHGDYRTIDGIVAGIMGLQAASVKTAEPQLILL